MFKRMVTMRKALHKREEDTTPRGVEADELVEELGRERSKTQRARRSRDTALEGSRRYEQLDRTARRGPEDVARIIFAAGERATR